MKLVQDVNPIQGCGPGNTKAPNGWFSLQECTLNTMRGELLG